MYRKNTAGQFFTFTLVKASDGTIITGGTATVKRTIDGGAQATATGTTTELSSSGQYSFALSQADTNGNNIGFLVTASTAVPQAINILTDGSPPDVNLKNAAGTAVTLDSNNVLNVSAKYVGGTLLTARDIGLSVLLAAGQKVDVDTIKTNPVVNAGTVTFPTGATLASTTNITGGVITTTTNLTNAGPDTAGTTTLLARVTATRAGYWDNLSGGAVALASGVTVTTNNDKTGYALVQAFPSNFSALAIDGSGLVTYNNAAPPSAASISTTLLGTAIDGAYTVKQALGYTFAFAAGTLSGVLTNTPVFVSKGAAFTITATQSADGRPTVVLS